MTEPSPGDDNLLSRTLSRLRDEGYLILERAPLWKVDKRLPRMHADFVARKGDEIVILEVRTRSTAYSDDDLLQLTDAVASVPSCTLNVVWLGESEEAPQEYEPSSLAARAQEVYFKDDMAGLLLAWAGLEGATTRCAHLAGLERVGPRQTARQTLSDLYGNKVITWNMYSQLMRIGQVRNQLAHGRFASISEDDFNYLVAAVRLLDSPEFRSSESVMDVLRNGLDRDEVEDVVSRGLKSVNERLYRKVDLMVGPWYFAADAEELIREIAQRDEPSSTQG